MDRQTAADLLDNLVGMVDDTQGNNYDDALKMGIEALRAERHGHWMDVERDDDHYVICSECGDEYIENEFRTDSWVKQYFRFCPRCGARMNGEHDG